MTLHRATACNQTNLTALFDGRAMIRITLDTNCIIDLEEGRPTSSSLRALIQHHQQGKAQLCLVGISASERQRNCDYAPTFASFQDKVAAVGLGNAEILKPMGYFGITYFDWCLWADNAMLELEKSIHSILFPAASFDCQDEEHRKWRNQKCDVLALWTHMYHGCDVFVSSDQNYFAPHKRQKLEELGAKRICSPKEAAQDVEATLL